MKKFILVVILFTLLHQLSFAQDTLKHITSGCIGHITATESDSCPEGIHFRYFEDTLEIFGTIWANCCGVHLAEIIRSEDTITISTFDTGQLCNCSCLFCFDIRLTSTTNDTIVIINGVTYNPRKFISINMHPQLNDKIKIYPVPAEQYLIIEVSPDIIIKKLTITDYLGKNINYFEQPLSYIDLDGFKAGLYLIQIELSDYLSVTKKLLIK